MNCKACGRELNPVPPTAEEQYREERAFYKAFDPDAIPEAVRIQECINRDNAPEEVFESKEGLCSQCVIECTRLTRIIEINQKPLTNREIAEIGLEHEELVKLMTDEQIEAHILDLKKKIEGLRIRLVKSGEVRAKRQMDKMALLTPEEIEDFKREQALKKVTISAERKARMSAMDKLIESFVKKGISRENAEKLVKGS